uniref:Uncharacterized protein n=1 Tax=Rhizophagus irregularis (strain DAOM 181602 / DAOM 197198 / MUCL 43194) TaxID=747089 RepID=U9UDM5_RHIID
MSTNDAIDAEASGNSEKNIIFQMIKFKSIVVNPILEHDKIMNILLFNSLIIFHSEFVWRICKMNI